jgi:trehalose 6-phosphate synthase/phosphatase
MGKTIIISNRLPVRLKKEEIVYSVTSSEGGLATGLGSIYKEGGNLWIGWPGTEVEENEQPEVAALLLQSSLIPVYLSAEEIAEFYEGFSNSILWPIFHYYASSHANYKASNWEYYTAVNRKFCEAALQVIEPGDTIWIHDYQLLLLPAMLRELLPESTIGFFCHIPFPSFELFRLIPWRTELVTGMCGADLLGFHTFDDASHFLNAATRLLPVSSTANRLTVDGRIVVAESFPMGVDFHKYDQLARQAGVRAIGDTIRESSGSTKIILSIDRLDYSKGILQRLQAFDELLDRHPEYRGVVQLHMIVVPSREDVPEYQALKELIDRQVGAINARFRTIDWNPVNYFYRSLSVEELSALYSVADICMVTPMRDGMNLVSKEYVASRVNEDGILILSEMAGASRELVDALIVNPADAASVRDAILESLVMLPAEQQRRMKLMREVVRKYNVHHWVKIFMDRLREVKAEQEAMQARQLTSITVQAVQKIYRKTQRRIIFLDYDGTLVGFKAEIDSARPDEYLYRLLGDLIGDEANTVVIVSGRNHNTLEEWFGHLSLELIAEHGAWNKQDGKWKSLPGLTGQWKQDLYPLLETYVDRTPGAFIEEKDYSLVWHYRKVERSLGELRTNELVNTLRYLINDRGLQILQGNKVVEIKNMEINKGKAASAIIHNRAFDFIMAMGDDHTDEDLFKALPENSLTVKVGNHLSAARFYLKSYVEVRQLLEVLPRS